MGNKGGKQAAKTVTEEQAEGDTTVSTAKPDSAKQAVEFDEEELGGEGYDLDDIEDGLDDETPSGKDTKKATNEPPSDVTVTKDMSEATPQETERVESPVCEKPPADVTVASTASPFVVVDTPKKDTEEKIQTETSEQKAAVQELQPEIAKTVQQTSDAEPKEYLEEPPSVTEKQTVAVTEQEMESAVSSVDTSVTKPKEEVTPTKEDSKILAEEQPAELQEQEMKGTKLVDEVDVKMVETAEQTISSDDQVTETKPVEEAENTVSVTQAPLQTDTKDEVSHDQEEKPADEEMALCTSTVQVPSLPDGKDVQSTAQDINNDAADTDTAELKQAEVDKKEVVVEQVNQKGQVTETVLFATKDVSEMEVQSCNDKDAPVSLPKDEDDMILTETTMAEQVKDDAPISQAQCISEDVKQNDSEIQVNVDNQDMPLTAEVTEIAVSQIEAELKEDNIQKETTSEEKIDKEQQFADESSEDTNIDVIGSHIESEPKVIPDKSDGVVEVMCDDKPENNRDAKTTEESKQETTVQDSHDTSEGSQDIVEKDQVNTSDVDSTCAAIGNVEATSDICEKNTDESQATKETTCDVQPVNNSTDVLPADDIADNGDIKVDEDVNAIKSVSNDDSCEVEDAINMNTSSNAMQQDAVVSESDAVECVKVEDSVDLATNDNVKDADGDEDIIKKSNDDITKSYSKEETPRADDTVVADNGDNKVSEENLTKGEADSNAAVVTHDDCKGDNDLGKNIEEFDKEQSPVIDDVNDNDLDDACEEVRDVKDVDTNAMEAAGTNSTANIKKKKKRNRKGKK